MKFNEIGEFGFIEYLREEGIPFSKDIIKGIGDDCAVFGPYEGKVLLFTTDMLLEGIHFLGQKIDFYQLGGKAIAVNISDIAAMGGSPLYCIISVGFPGDSDVESIKEMYRGMKDTCGRYGVKILGGDTVKSPDRLVINVSMIGETEKGEVLYRSGAKPDERIYATGITGDSCAGVKALKNEISVPEHLRDYFIRKHNEPLPHVEAGRLVAGSRLASSMIDLSDGLISDLGHICGDSGVGALIFRESIPISWELRELASINHFDPVELAVSGGEDYVLLITVPEKNTRRLEQLFRDKGSLPLYMIGRTTRDRGIMMEDKDGSVEPANYRGFDHFSS